ncbi:hypothetical protein XBJ2_210047 [Xenorhabdus bovienii str. Jollieti]|uniref:Uncharacterized protein n=1 Tax=Xenorhabdus bovienii (strain SS-2004) TaxID=406818 RepID=D3UWI9_XENBS|nr:hypothetical protein XBJ1_0619 [Xenorhabdus bovienii SS-2004]CDH28990.1 hypothetical protein XBJ2_210047 [Xenorhabdus bovienii str. Jollieti]
MKTQWRISVLCYYSNSLLLMYIHNDRECNERIPTTVLEVRDEAWLLTDFQPYSA